MRKMIPFAEIKAEMLKNPEFKAEYDKLQDEFDLICAMIDARKEAGLTQAQIAEKMGVSQNQVARIESQNVNVRYKSIVEYLRACGKKIAIV